MNISLTPDLDQFVGDNVDSSRYTSVSEIICEALRLMASRDQQLYAFNGEMGRPIERLCEANGYPGKNSKRTLGRLPIKEGKLKGERLAVCLGAELLPRSRLQCRKPVDERVGDLALTESSETPTSGSLTNPSAMQSVSSDLLACATPSSPPKSVAPSSAAWHTSYTQDNKRLIS